MRRETRKHEIDNNRTLIYAAGGVIVVAIIAFVVGMMLFSNKLKNDALEGEYSTSKISSLVPNTITTENIVQDASTEIGKTVAELKNEQEENVELEKKETIFQVQEQEEIEEDTVQTVGQEAKIAIVENDNLETVASTEEAKDPVFTVPVQGEIIREFANDKLVYSETLEEWVSHNGIDIKAEKTTVVKASANGKVSTIKNDPRYGLTVTILHDNGFKTVYANLLTAEFVTEGETVESGQTIGTVGNTATFEILDEPHLHFEILKDNEYLDPSIYLKQ